MEKELINYHGWTPDIFDSLQARKIVGRKREVLILLYERTRMGLWTSTPEMRGTKRGGDSGPRRFREIRAELGLQFKIKTRGRVLYVKVADMNRARYWIQNSPDGWPIQDDIDDVLSEEK